MINTIGKIISLIREQPTKQAKIGIVKDRINALDSILKKMPKSEIETVARLNKTLYFLTGLKNAIEKNIITE